jgi:hypothetical protein
VLAYVQNAQGPFDLSADSVLYLRDLGVSQPVITSMLNHDSALRSQAPDAPAQTYAPTPTSAAPASGPPPMPGPEALPPQQAAPPASYVSSPPPDATYFYNDLAPYGSWVSLPSVGWCWQPSVVVVNRDWRPYCDAGHWVYTDDGWFWQSDYSWGWAPFHYGRWYLDGRCGWVWVPGRVWGPAWVTWRTVGTTCGWAPLPPGADFVMGAGWRFNGVAVNASFDFGLGVNAFAFVSFGNFCSPNVAHYRMPHAQAVNIYRQTTIVNNYTVVNNTYVNHGISVNRIEAASHNRVPRATVHEGHPGTGRPAGASRDVVYRAPLRAPERSAHMVAQKVDPAHPVIQHHAALGAGAGQRSSALGSGAGSSSGFQRTPNPALRTEQKPGSNGGSAGTTRQHAPGQVKGQPSAPIGTTTTGSAATGGAKSPNGTAQTRQWQTSEKPASNTRTWSAPATTQTPVPKQATRSFKEANPAPTANPYPQGAASKGQLPATANSHNRPGQAYGNSVQGQPTVDPTPRQNTTARFYNPKTVEQSSQVRSIYQQPKGNSAVAPGSIYRQQPQGASALPSGSTYQAPKGASALPSGNDYQSGSKSADRFTRSPRQ